MKKAGSEVEAEAMKETGDLEIDHDTEIKREDHVTDLEIEIETGQEISVERDQEIDIEKDQDQEIDTEKDQDQNTETDLMKDTGTNQGGDHETGIKVVRKNIRKRKIQN